MPYYYVDGNDLTSVANSIRTAGGASSSIQFPDGFITAIGNISTGGGFFTVTVSAETTTTTASYDAVQQLIGTATEWFAWVDDVSYVISGGDKCVAIMGCNSSAERSLYRNDSSYNYYRRFPYGTNVCKIPANTTFNVLFMPTLSN